MMIEEHGEGVLLALEEGADTIQLHTYLGVRMPLHTTALGKAILAHLPADRVDEHGLTEMTKQTVTDRETPEAQL